MKFCIHCGSQLSDEAQFCTNCGAKTGPSETLGTIKAPDSEGEFVLATWSEPSNDQPAERKEKTPKKQAPKKSVEPKEKSKNRGCFGYILLFGKVLLIAVGSVFLLVLAIEYFSDDEPDSPKYEQKQSPTKSSVFPEAENLDGSDNVESAKDDEIIDLEKMAPEDAIALCEDALQQTKAELKEELNKGDDANEEKIEMLRFDIELYQNRIKKYRQQLQND